MAKEKIEDVSTGVLLKRKKFFFVLAGIFIGLLLVYIVFSIYDLSRGEGLKKTTLYSAIIPFAGAWIPFFAIIRINTELKRRGEK